MINIKNLNKFNRNDEGVSPVIGVILMVAATIVIAGVIMAMLGGFAPVEPPRSVTAIAHHINTTHIAVVYHGGPDAGQVANVSARIGGREATLFVNNSTHVGNSTIFTGTAGPGNDHIVVDVLFLDGRRQVILDTRV